MSENLRDEMERALKEAWRDRAMSVSFDVTWRAMTDAAWSVVGPELDRLRAEVAEAGSMRDHYERCFNEANDSAAGALRAYRTAEAERDDLRAALAKVEADRERLHDLADTIADWATGLRAALASVPEPSDSEPHAPCCDACGGSGASDEASSNGLCWDCRGTGCAHEPSDSEPAPDADREAGGE